MPAKRPPHFTITRRYYEHLEDYDTEVSEATYEPVERPVDFDPSECALVLVDVWSANCMGQDGFDSVTREKIAPVVRACRRAGILVVHAPCPQVADKHPDRRFKPTPPDQWLFAHPAYAADWPTPDMRSARGPYREYNLSRTPDAPVAPEVDRYRNYFIHPAVLPEGNDVVIGDRKELHLLLQDRRIWHLFYAGFATNGCMLERDYGIRWVGYLGYDITLLRDCTRATEMSHTLPTMEQTRASIDNLQFWIATSSSDSFLDSLRKARLTQ